MIAALALGLGMSVLTLGSLAIPAAMIIEIATGDRFTRLTHPSYGMNLLVLQVMVLLVALAHLTNIALWAGLLCACGEFESFDLAFYHSAVNYSSLGYGDLVMSPRWRLLGPLETLDGLVKVSISTALMFSLMGRLIGRRLSTKEHEQKHESVS